MSYSLYYQARVERSQTWYVVGILRSFEHLVFDRTLNKQEGIMEYYIPHELEFYFLEIMAYFISQGIVKDLIKLPNRLENSKQEV